MKEIQEAIEDFRNSYYPHSDNYQESLRKQFDEDVLHLLSLVAEKQRDKCHYYTASGEGGEDIFNGVHSDFTKINGVHFDFTKIMGRILNTPLITDTLKEKP